MAALDHAETDDNDLQPGVANRVPTLARDGWLHAMLSAFEPPSVMEQIREAEEDDVLVEEEETL